MDCGVKACGAKAVTKLEIQRLQNLSGNVIDDKVSERTEFLCEVHADEADGKFICNSQGKGFVQYVTASEPC